MNRWLREHRLAASDGASRLLASPMASALNILVIGVALSLPVALYLGLVQLQTFTRQLSGDPQISIFLNLETNSTTPKRSDNACAMRRKFATTSSSHAAGHWQT